MKNRSLKIRLLALQALAVILALGITGNGLTFLFERHVERRIGAELDTYLAQIAARLSFLETGVPLLNNKLADPRFDKIYSGLYWQINNETEAQSARSRSLWDSQLNLPVDAPPLGDVHIHTISGPQGSSLLVHERRIVFNTTNGEQTVRFAIALDRQELTKLSSEFGGDVAMTLSILGLFLLLAGWAQVTIGLVPLSFVQKSVAAIRNGETTRIEAIMPQEISPLVEEVNDLLSMQESAIRKAKNRADNLAHGFKTPLTALGADIKRLREKGENEIADEIELTATIMRRQIEKELAKTRIRDVKRMPRKRILPIAESVVRTLRRTPDGEKRQIQVECPPHLSVQIDKDDLTEILGNLIENAVKHSASLVTVKIQDIDETVLFEIEDDGPGISSEMMEIVQRRGVRLDRSIAGSGIGLAIVNDVLEAYNGNLSLTNSQLGGLKASFQLPMFYGSKSNSTSGNTS